MSNQLPPDYTPHSLNNPKHHQLTSHQYQQGNQATYDHPPSHTSSSAWARPQDAYSPPPISTSHTATVNPTTYEHPPSHISDSPWARPQDAFLRPQQVYHPPSHPHQSGSQETDRPQHQHDAQYKAWEKEKKLEKEKADAAIKADTAWREGEGERWKKEKAEAMNKADNDWKGFTRGLGQTGKKINWRAKDQMDDKKREKEKADALDKADQEWMATMRAEPADMNGGFRRFWKKDK